MSLGIPIVNKKKGKGKGNGVKQVEKLNHIGGFTIEFDEPELVPPKKNTKQSTPFPPITTVESKDKQSDFHFEDLFHTQSKELDVPSIEVTPSTTTEDTTQQTDTTLYPSDSK